MLISLSCSQQQEQQQQPYKITISLSIYTNLHVYQSVRLSISPTDARIAHRWTIITLIAQGQWDSANHDEPGKTQKVQSSDVTATDEKAANDVWY